jgi:hypothetical protein
MMKMDGGIGVEIYIFLTVALAGGERSASHPQPLYRQRNNPQYPLDRSWEPLEPVSRMWRRKNSLPYQDLNFDPSDIQPIASCCTEFAILYIVLVLCTYFITI